MNGRAGDPGARVAIVGGGLAGLAAAAALVEQGCQVDLFESRRRLGGRAASFRDPATGEVVDHCQHVSMGCCTNLSDLCRRAGVVDWFSRHQVLHFVGPDGRRSEVHASAAPAPLHLAWSLARPSFFSWRERWSIARDVWRLARFRDDGAAETTAMADWLRALGAPEPVMRRFWGTILVSALGESLDRVSVAAARKVMVDGFLASRTAYEIEVPSRPLVDLYDGGIGAWLRRRGVRIHLETPVATIEGRADLVRELVTADGARREFEFVVLAVPWRRVRGLLSEALWSALPELEGIERIESAPITAVHLWFDRPIMDLPHAVLVDRLGQWVFRRGRGSWSADGGRDAHYYQVVISASRDVVNSKREAVVAEVVGELRAVWPDAAAAKLLHARLVTDPQAVFSMRPGVERLRPPQQTAIANLMLAGDWTRTGWPATMEGAVRGGRLAAEAVLRAVGRPMQLTTPDLPAGRLARLFGFC